jgi:hypothetical protein
MRGWGRELHIASPEPGAKMRSSILPWSLGIAIISVLSVCFGRIPAFGDAIFPKHHHGLDPYNHGADFTTFCDFTEGAPISDKCYGFVAATVEIAMNERVLKYSQDKNQSRWRACVPVDLTVPQIFEQIRPNLRKNLGTCGGFCTSTFYIINALNETYPCRN